MNWTRRAFLKTAGAAAIGSAFRSAAAAGDTISISILHTTDLHGHILPTSDYSGRDDLGGFARCMTQIRRWREANPHSLLIDLGDVYQGTDVALRTRGSVMIELLNLARYDAWVLGNHEFDWGFNAFAQAVEQSEMPVLAANASSEHVQPYVLKDFSGIRIAVIGVATPGMAFWFRPDFLGGIDFEYPVEPVRHAIAKAKSEGADAIVLAGHMGLKERTGGDDFANCANILTSEFPEAAVFIAGHTHRMIDSRLTNGVVLTQADHFGIHAGRVELTFDRSSKKLLRTRAECVLMDDGVELDASVLSRAKPHLDESAQRLSETVGDLAEALSARTAVGEPSDVEMLIGAAIAEALVERGAGVDGVFHGLFEEKRIPRGPKTIADLWAILPYENQIVTAELSGAEIMVMMQDVLESHERRNLMGFDVAVEGAGREKRLASVSLGGERLPERARYKIAFNTFDSRSGGHRFMKLREMLERADANCTLHQLQTRDALISYFQRHKVVRRVRSLRNEIAAAA